MRTFILPLSRFQYRPTQHAHSLSLFRSADLTENMQRNMKYPPLPHTLANSTVTVAITAKRSYWLQISWMRLELQCGISV